MMLSTVLGIISSIVGILLAIFMMLSAHGIFGQRDISPLLLPLRCTTLSRKNHPAAAATLHYAFAQKISVAPTPPRKRSARTEINLTLWK